MRSQIYLFRSILPTILWEHLFILLKIKFNERERERKIRKQVLINIHISMVTYKFILLLV